MFGPVVSFELFLKDILIVNHTRTKKPSKPKLPIQINAQAKGLANTVIP